MTHCEQNRRILRASLWDTWLLFNQSVLWNHASFYFVVIFSLICRKLKFSLNLMFFWPRQLTVALIMFFVYSFKCYWYQRFRNHNLGFLLLSNLKATTVVGHSMTSFSSIQSFLIKIVFLNKTSCATFLLIAKQLHNYTTWAS